MRIVAARFRERHTALDVLESLRCRFELGPHDADVAPLATGDAKQMTVLAGRFREARVHEVVELVHRAGGEVVIDVDETWTQVRRPPPVEHHSYR